MRISCAILVVTAAVSMPGCRKGPAELSGDVGRKARPAAEETIPAGPQERQEDALIAAAPDAGTAAAAAGADVAAEESVPAAPDVAGLRWTLTPAQLDVMRDTVVEMAVEWPGVPEADFRCLFDPGDRSHVEQGCRVKHRFEGGLADREVTVLVEYRSREIFRESRPLPLERLPVKRLAAADSGLPPREKIGDAGRTAFAGLFAAPDEAATEGLAAALDQTGADLAFLFLSFDTTSQAAGALLERLNATSARTVVPVYCRPGGLQGAAPVVRSTRLLAHGEGNEPPWQHAFLAGGNLYVLLDPRRSSLEVEQEKWMLAALESGRVAEHRVVVSCLPLEKLTPKDLGELQPQFRYYEKLMRGDVSLFVSSTYPVFYHARYGDLETLSAGCALGEPGVLLSSVRTQPGLLSVVDFPPKAEPAVYAVSPEGAAGTVELGSLPYKVGSYVLEL